jgi:hypothetical protein
MSGLYICAIYPSYDTQNKNTLTCCRDYGDFKVFLKGCFSLYVTAAILAIVGLNGVMLSKMYHRVSCLWSDAISQLITKNFRLN